MVAAASFLTGSCAVVVAGFFRDGVRRGASAGLAVVLMVLGAALAVDALGLTGSLLGEALRCSGCLLAEERSVGFRRDRVRASEDMVGDEELSNVGLETEV